MEWNNVSELMQYVLIMYLLIKERIGLKRDNRLIEIINEFMKNVFEILNKNEGSNRV